MAKKKGKNVRVMDPADRLPKHKPKATGRRGIGPKDDEAVAGTNRTASEIMEDEPNVKPGSVAAHNLSEQAPPEKKEPPKQLLKVAKQPTPAIQNDRMSAHFIGFRAHRHGKERTRVVTMRFSLELVEEHEGRLPDEIETEWKHFKKAKCKMSQPTGMTTQNVSLSIAPDQDPDEFTADVPKAVLTNVIEKGKGNTRRITRLEIHLLTTFTADAERFCRNTYDEMVWMTLEEAQESLFDEDED